MNLKFRCDKKAFSGLLCARLRETAETYLQRAVALDGLWEAKLPRIEVKRGELSGSYFLGSRRVEIRAPSDTSLADLLFLLLHEISHWRFHALSGGNFRELEEYEAEERACDIEAGRATGLTFSPMYNQPSGGR